MKTKLPDCPACSEPDLYLRRMGDQFECRCADCGYSTGIVTLGTGEELNEIVAIVVAAAKEEARDE